MSAVGLAPLRASVVAGVPIDDITLAETVDLVGSFVALGRSDCRTFQIATVNVDFVVKALRDNRASTILRQAELCLPDGMPIIWYSRLLGTALRTRVTGADLVPALAARSAQTGHLILLFGSAPGVAEQAAALLRANHPGAVVVGISGSRVSDDGTFDRRELADLAAVDADIICVALGNPKQEKWIDANRESLRCPVLIGVGGTLDFLVGGRRRAPGWMQRHGLEWIFRAVQEPRRLGQRYVHDARIFGPLLASAAWRRLRAPASATDRWSGSATKPTTGEFDASKVNCDDERQIAVLVGWVRSARRAGERFRITGASKDLSELLSSLGCDTTTDFGPRGAS
ncbi:MAG: WecB/TagA/CpsF family glycosyltransferase [Ilumatobacteraceae bacterium]